MFNLKLSGFVLLLATTMLVTNAEATTIKNGTHKHIHHTSNCNKTNFNCNKNSADTKRKESVFPLSFGDGSLFDDAKKYIGLSERTNKRQIQSITDVNPVRTPWCAAFINGILERNGYKTSSDNRASSFLHYGTRVTVPKKGDIVLLGRRGRISHVGIFSHYEMRNGRKYVALLGGNQSNRVQISSYPASRIISIRRPA